MRSFCCVLGVVIALAGGRASAVVGEELAPPSAFRVGVEPALKKYCVRCHGSDRPKGGLDLTGIDWDLVNGPDGETWHDILTRLNKGEMPPESAPQLAPSEHQTMVKQITNELRRLTDARRNDGGKVVLRRLTRYEYANTMRDLLGIDADFARELPPEPASPDGFRNNGSSLGISPLQIEYYLQAARTALGKAIVTGPAPEVYQDRAEKSSNNRRKKQAVGNKLGPTDQFLMVVKNFPREGEVVVRVRASGYVPEKAGYPRVRVSLGVRADTLAPMKTLGETDVTAPLDSPRVYEFRGRIEEFPLPGKNPKFPGLMITVENVSSDGEGVPQNTKNKKNQNKTKGSDLDPTQPRIEIEAVEFEGPVFEQWPPAHHTRILFPSPRSGDEKAYAREVLARFMTRAFRRPATDDEIALHIKLYDTVRPRVSSFEEAMREVLSVVLVSPEFLYLVEPTNGTEKAQRPLSQYELASRLSYFLWSTMPDEELSRLAAEGTLRDPKILGEQVRRMIADESSWEFVRHFTDQWLDLSAAERVAVNPEYYPGFDDRLKEDMRHETEHFFAEVLHRNLSAMTLLDSDFAMLNRPLANHYGLVGPKGAAFERVSLNTEDRRGGLLTQGSILLGNSTGEHSHPIRRAVWVLDRLLDDPPAPPPPDVPELNQDEPDLAALSLRKQLEIHRTKTACMNCHRNIDPWGIAFENYDAVGLWREQVTLPKTKKQKTPPAPVEANTSLPDGSTIDGMAGLKSHLLTHKRDQFARALTVKLLTYALGRSLGLADEPVVESLTTEFAQSGYRLDSLITAIVRSDVFGFK